MWQRGLKGSPGFLDGGVIGAGGGASSPSVLTILNQWEWKWRRERAWLTPDPEAQAWKPAPPRSVSWRPSIVREQKGYVPGVISWLTGQWG